MRNPSLWQNVRQVSWGLFFSNTTSQMNVSLFRFGSCGGFATLLLWELFWCDCKTSCLAEMIEKTIAQWKYISLQNLGWRTSTRCRKKHREFCGYILVFSRWIGVGEIAKTCLPRRRGSSRNNGPGVIQFNPLEAGLWHDCLCISTGWMAVSHCSLLHSVVADFWKKKITCTGYLDTLSWIGAWIILHLNALRKIHFSASHTGKSLPLQLISKTGWSFEFKSFFLRQNSSDKCCELFFALRGILNRCCTSVRIFPSFRSPKRKWSMCVVFAFWGKLFWCDCKTSCLVVFCDGRGRIFNYYFFLFVVSVLLSNIFWVVKTKSNPNWDFLPPSISNNTKPDNLFYYALFRYHQFVRSMGSKTFNTDSFLARGIFAWFWLFLSTGNITTFVTLDVRSYFWFHIKRYEKLEKKMDRICWFTLPSPHSIFSKFLLTSNRSTMACFHISVLHRKTFLRALV